MEKATAKKYPGVVAAHLTFMLDGESYGKRVGIGGEIGARALHKAVKAALKQNSYVRVALETGQSFTVRRRDGRA